MADIVTLDEAKAWLRVLHDHEDALILLLVAAASEAVLETADGWDGTGEVPDRLKLACLARLAVAYDDRVNVSAGTGEDRLVQPFRVLAI
ncbi:head-tail connector protein [Novosphingobium sp. HII-3]|uniref:head-tail connector protein n=1 Tax=Novosphingobium sp. HII-3 TaxID=2075565 RepID=UPI000CDB8B02|nr:head-tail connector protein [Novosphingobium sp. HII-3]